MAGVTYSEDIQRGDASLLRRELRAAMLNLQHVKDGTHPQGQENPGPKLKKLYDDIGAGTRWEEILQVMANWGVILNGHQEAA